MSPIPTPLHQSMGNLVWKSGPISVKFQHKVSTVSSEKLNNLWLNKILAVSLAGNYFWATVCKTVHPPFVKRFALCYRFAVCPVCLSVTFVHCDQTVGRIKTWLAGRPPTWPHCVRWGPSSPSPKGAQQTIHFLAHAYCDQTVGRIKMPVGV